MQHASSDDRDQPPITLHLQIHLHADFRAAHQARPGLASGCDRALKVVKLPLCQGPAIQGIA